jgi:hypothetical protein
LLLYFDEPYGILRNIMVENPKSLGSGIATARPDKPLDNAMRIMYVPSEEGARLMRSLGFLYGSIDERHAEETLQVGKLGVSDGGNVWRKGENGKVTMIANKLDLTNTLQAVKTNGEEFTLNEFEDQRTGKRILARTLPDDGSRRAFQIWLVKDPKDMQYLVDAVFCLHFHQPATDDHGVALNEDQILHEALHVGITFDMSIEGKPLLPQLPQE